MNETLETIKDAWDSESGSGRNEFLARQQSDAYVAANPETFEEYKNLSIVECVEAVDVLREAHLEELRWKMEAWLLHRFSPQRIGGPVEAEIRVVSPTESEV